MTDKQVIKDFVDMMEDDWSDAKESYDNSSQSNYWSGAINEFQRIMESHEYQALKASISPVSGDKAEKVCNHVWVESHLWHGELQPNGYVCKFCGIQPQAENSP